MRVPGGRLSLAAVVAAAAADVDGVVVAVAGRRAAALEVAEETRRHTNCERARVTVTVDVDPTRTSPLLREKPKKKTKNQTSRLL